MINRRLHKIQYTPGLGQRNVLELEWSQVNLELHHAWTHAGQSKNRRPITVPLNDTAIQVLQRQLGKHATRVFTYSGKPLKAANTKAWGNALKRAGITDFRWYDLDTLGQHGNGKLAHQRMSYNAWVAGEQGRWQKHLAPEQLATAAARLDSVFAGNDLATVRQK